MIIILKSNQNQGFEKKINDNFQNCRFIKSNQNHQKVIFKKSNIKIKSANYTKIIIIF
jgi:hypothetical protein